MACRHSLLTTDSGPLHTKALFMESTEEPETGYRFPIRQIGELKPPGGAGLTKAAHCTIVNKGSAQPGVVTEKHDDLQTKVLLTLLTQSVEV
jgi:hypothetical protein